MKWKVIKILRQIMFLMQIEPVCPCFVGPHVRVKDVADPARHKHKKQMKQEDTKQNKAMSQKQIKTYQSKELSPFFSSQKLKGVLFKFNPTAYHTTQIFNYSVFKTQIKTGHLYFSLKLFVGEIVQLT